MEWLEGGERQEVTLRTSRLTPDEKRKLEDEAWALQHPDVTGHYCGKFVVPYLRKIIASGDDRQAVLDEAARVTSRSPDELPVVRMPDSLLEEITDYSTFP